MKTRLQITPDYGYIPIDEEGIAYTYKKKPGDIINCTISQETGKRTGLQNKSLHKYLTNIAQQLADSGQDMRQIVKLPITPTTDNVKENMFKPVMTALYPDKTSTTELSTIEIQKCYEVFNAAMGERLGVSADWPNRDSMLSDSMGLTKVKPMINNNEE